MCLLFPTLEIMSFLNSLLSLIGGPSNLSSIVSDVQKAMASGQKPDAIIGKQLTQKLSKLLPKNSANIVEALDQLIPDSMEQKLGVTPDIKRYIKEAVSAHKGVAPTVS